jgi:hypothetical protein
MPPDVGSTRQAIRNWLAKAGLYVLDDSLSIVSGEVGGGTPGATSLTGDVTGTISGQAIPTTIGASKVTSGMLAASALALIPAAGARTLTGDVTGSNSGTDIATLIAANKVLTAAILDGNVTLAKLASLAASTLIGRISGSGTGVPSAITLGGGLSISAGGVLDVTVSGLTGVMRVARKVLTNAEILQLSTTPIEVVAAGGSNTILIPVACRVYGNLAGGTIGGGIGVSLRYAGVATDLTNVSLNALLNNSVKSVSLIPTTQSVDPGTDYVNKGLVIKGNANGTTGNSANFCVVETAYYSTLVTNTP